MDAPPPRPESLHSPAVADDSERMAEFRPPSKTSIHVGKSITLKNKNKKKTKKKLSVDVSDVTSSSTSSFCSTSHSLSKGIRVLSKQRNPRVLIGSARQKEGDVEALALPLGMSIAAVVAQVLERKESIGGKMAVDHLSKICTLAVRESLANVFGDKFDTFARNFEKSFHSTLLTLRLINESTPYAGEQTIHLNNESNYGDMIPQMSVDKEPCFTCCPEGRECQSEVVHHTISAEVNLDSLEETEQSTRTDGRLPLYDEINQQLACVSRHTSCSIVNEPRFSTSEKSVIELTRANDLKTFEIGLIMRKLQLKEKQLALNSDLNFLERWKLSMGISKASFKAEKFRYEVQETGHAELLKRCIDCLVAGLFIMLAAIGYGTYVHSQNRITEATASCMPFKESKSWWIPKPMASFNSGLQILWCQVLVVSRMLFGVLMILAIAYLLLQRSAVSAQTMPVTFIILLGFACGLAGKLCMDTLGGSGYHWLLHWEVLCLLHFLSNVFTSTLFLLLHGPVNVSQGVKSKTRFPYWMRRLLFYATTLLFLPLSCGLMPFASPGEWIDHFKLKAIDFLQGTSD